MGKIASFTDQELEDMLADVFVAACHPATRERCGENRMRYLGEAATEIVLRLRGAVNDGDVGRFELPVVLIGAALGALRLARREAQA